MSIQLRFIHRLGGILFAVAIALVVVGVQTARVRGEIVTFYCWVGGYEFAGCSGKETCFYGKYCEFPLFEQSCVQTDPTNPCVACEFLVLPHSCGVELFCDDDSETGQYCSSYLDCYDYPYPCNPPPDDP